MRPPNDPTLPWIDRAIGLCFGMALGIFACTHDPRLAFLVPAVAFFAGVIVAVVFLVGDLILTVDKGGE